MSFTSIPLFTIFLGAISLYLSLFSGWGSCYFLLKTTCKDNERWEITYPSSLILFKHKTTHHCAPQKGYFSMLTYIWSHKLLWSIYMVEWIAIYPSYLVSNLTLSLNPFSNLTLESFNSNTHIYIYIIKHVSHPFIQLATAHVHMYHSSINKGHREIWLASSKLDRFANLIYITTTTTIIMHHAY